MTVEPLIHIELEQSFARWAASRPDVRAVVVIGSRARTDHPADEWSDLDLLVFTRQPAEYAGQTDWLASIGEVRFTARERITRDDWVPFLAIFSGMRKVDIVFTRIPASCSPLDDLNQLLAASPYPYIFSNGVRVLYDQHPSNASLETPVELVYSPRLPSHGEFTNDVHLFWSYVIHTATLIRHAEWWRAAQLMQVELKSSLLTFIERQARLHFGLEHKVWPRGCYLADWADPRVLAALPQCFFVNSSDDLWHALLAISELFHWLAVEIADGLGFIYPLSSEECARDWINNAYSSHLL